MSALFCVCEVYGLSLPLILQVQWLTTNVETHVLLRISDSCSRCDISYKCAFNLWNWLGNEKIHSLLVNILLLDDTAYSLLVMINLNTPGNVSERGIEAMYVYNQHKMSPFLHPAGSRWRWVTALYPSHFTAGKNPSTWVHLRASLDIW